LRLWSGGFGGGTIGAAAGNARRAIAATQARLKKGNADFIFAILLPQTAHEASSVTNYREKILFNAAGIGPPSAQSINSAG